MRPAPPAPTGRRMPSFAAPAFVHAGRLEFAFDEDLATLAWDAAAVARLPPGAALAVEGATLPEWWWKGTRLQSDPASARRLRVVAASLGPVAFVEGPGDRIDPEALAHAAVALAPALDADAVARIRKARNTPDGEADFPLGAHVAPARHDEVLVERMGHPGGKVVTWTRIEPGAAPTEFLRLQEAVGAYHVVLVEAGDGRRTVGLWSGAAPPAAGGPVRPALRRLFRQQGAWRHGVKFAPAHA